MKLSKDELRKFRKQEEKKQAILHDLGLLQTQSHTLSHMFAELSFDGGNNANNFFGKTKALAVWKEALSDSELQSLTTI